jgi:Fe-S cluster biosynthesis and repair protein YggX
LSRTCHISILLVDLPGAINNMMRLVQCIKLGREAPGLERPPFPGAMGQRIFENVSIEAWKVWLEQQKMLVNENRLSLADPKARKYLMEQTEKYFFGTGADTAAGYVPPPRD